MADLINLTREIMKELLSNVNELDEAQHQKPSVMDRNRIIDAVRKWGSPVAEAVLEPGFDFYHTHLIEGYIGYKRIANYAIVFGDPICPPSNTEKLALEFKNYCKEHHIKCLYLLVSENFAKWGIRNIGKVLIEIGENLIFNPHEKIEFGRENSKLRNYIHHAQNLGYKVYEYFPTNKQIEKEIEQVGKEWEDARKGPQLSLGPLDFFSNLKGKRLFYVKGNEEMVAVANLCKIESRNGWLLKFLITTSDAPRGTSELLMTSILEKLRSEHCNYLTNGMIPGENLGEIVGLSKFSSWFARKIFNAVSWYFKLNQRKNYWQKYHPESESTYILFSEPNLGLKDIYTILKTLKMKI